MEQYTDFLKTYSNENFGLRLSFLRARKGVSARKMSLELGQNKNYISGIEAGNHFPTMGCFLEICYYLGITPSEFFNDVTKNASDEDKAMTELLYQLPPHVFQHFFQIIYDFIENSVY